MSNVTSIKKEELTLQEKSEAILSALFPDGSIEEIFKVILDGRKKAGKLYLPLCQPLAGLVNTPMDFPVKVEVRQDKTVIHF